MSLPGIKIYHYTNASHWYDIVEGSEFEGIKPGLSPQRSIGSMDDEAWRTKVIFGLLKPQPEQWVSNPYFKNTWPVLKRDLTRRGGSLLLEIKVDPDRDKVWVADRAHMEGHFYPDEASVPAEYRHSTKELEERHYMESRVPLLTYLNSADTLDFSLPEVISPQEFPLDRIAVSHQQPLLEARLAKYPPEATVHSDMLSFIGRTPELQPWYSTYQERQRGMNNEGRIVRERG